MNNQPRIGLKKLAIALSAFAFLNCGANPDLAGVQDEVGKVDGNGAVKSTIVLGKVGALKKGSAINLNKLYVRAISSATPADTVIDSAAISGNEAATVIRTLTLKPLRNWVVSAMTRDQKDSVIHFGTSSPFFLKPADTAEVTLNLNSRFSMYQANFNTLPDSISSTVAGTGKDKLNLNRVVLKIDGVARADSVLVAGYFPAGQNVTVNFDYIAPGNHTVTLEAYGTLHTYSGILYTGAGTYSVAPGVDDTRSVTLHWVGPTTGTGKLTVNLGRVGKVVVNGGIPGAIL